MVYNLLPVVTPSLNPKDWETIFSRPQITFHLIKSDYINEPHKGFLTEIFTDFYHLSTAGSAVPVRRMAESIKNDLMDDLTFLISELFELSF